MKLPLLALLVAALSAHFSPAIAVDTARPNLIFILADDVGLGNVGCYGGPFKTPHLDALAAGGTRFEHCYASPYCSPSRATCLTGRYVFRTGMRTNSSADSFNRNEIMVPKVLKTAGYVAAQVGKWNLPREPDEWGFDEYLHFQGSGKYWSDQAKTYTQNNETIELGERYLPDVMHEFLVDFLKRHKAEPFYVHYALSQLHAPIVRTPDSRPGNTDLYADNVAYVDKLMGQLVDALERLGLREKTLLVFVGDNGTAPTFASQATVHGRAISGAKGSLLEGGSRVPLIVNWPGTTPAGRVLEDLTDFSDFLPTFAELGGAKLPDAKIDGHSLAAQIKGHPGRPRDWIYMQLGEKRYVRDARWKLTGEGKLFDLKEAPFQELAVSADTTDPDAKAGREKLHAVLSDLQSQDPGPPTPRQDEKRKKAVQ